MDRLWFRTRAIELNVSYRALARKMKINQSIISHIFIGRRKMRLSEVQYFADELKVSPVEIVKRAGLKLPKWIDLQTIEEKWILL
jgi:transcriptional regulator with XRE-family HTH domain